MIMFANLFDSKSELLTNFAKISSIGGLIIYGGWSGLLLVYPLGFLILFCTFFSTFLVTKLIYLVVPRTLENRWKINTWFTIAWFLPFWFLWTAPAVATLTLLGYPMFAAVNIIFGNYDNTNLILNVYGELINSYAIESTISLRELTVKFFLFDPNMPWV